MGEDLKIGVGADLTSLEEGLAKAQEVVAEAAERMKGSLESVTKAFEYINVAMAAMTAVLAGGAAFKEAVSASVGAATGAAALGRELGITATQASILKVAMDENYVPMEAVTGAANKIAAAIKKNPAEFERLGVAIRDSNGNMRSSFDIMEDVNEKLAAMHDGTARNVEGQRIYGKAWETIAPTLRLTHEAMEEAQEKAESLGLVVGKEGVAQAKEYRMAMAGVHSVFDGIEKAIGDALIPVLTKLGQWFESVGPKAVQMTKGAIVGLVAIVQDLYAAFITAAGGIVIAWEYVTGYLVTAYKTIDRAAHLDFSGAADEWNQGMAKIVTNTKARVAEIKKAWSDAGATIDDVAGRLASRPTPTDDKGGKKTIGEDDSGKSRMAKWENELAQAKVTFQAEADAKGHLLEFSKQQEIDYWTKILATRHASAEETTAILAKVLGDELAIEKERHEAKLALIKNEETEAGKNLQARLAAEMKYAQAVKDIYLADSKQYAEAQKAIIATKQAMVEQVRKVDEVLVQSARARNLAEISNAEMAAQEQYDLGRMSMAQLLAAQRDFENQKYQIALKAAADELALADPNTDPVQYAQRCAQIEALAAAHQAAMAKIQNKAATEEMSKWKQLQTTLTSSMATAFSSIIDKSATVHQAFTKMMDTMLKSVINVVGQMMAKWVEQAALNLLLNRKATLSNAGTAASGAMASAAAIPYIGWILAPIEGAAVYAAALGFASAAGGYDIPAGLNPMTQLHAQEMVLPAKIAEPLRENLERGGGLGGGSFHVHTSNIDARSMERSLKRGGSLEKAMRDLHRRMKR